jgi:hypothetical protein
MRILLEGILFLSSPEYPASLFRTQKAVSKSPLIESLKALLPLKNEKSTLLSLLSAAINVRLETSISCLPKIGRARHEKLIFGKVLLKTFQRISVSVKKLIILTLKDYLIVVI